MSHFNYSARQSRWKKTRDRGVLLRLPVEERTVLESLLPKNADAEVFATSLWGGIITSL